MQWTLYYPPIIDYSYSTSDSSIKSALESYRQGNIYQSLAKLDETPATQRSHRYLTLKAALLLSVGRVDEAQPLILQAQNLESGNSDAFALQAVIAIAKNHQQAALELANRAVTANPQSAVAKIAQSYAYQALFNIDEALKATQEATRLTPGNALAWARLSELQLSKGDHDAALISAQKAQTLNPQVSRTQTVAGFANLAKTDIDAAKQAFEQALILDSSDPLARLGLGLAKIRKGDLEEGKNELETAINLDPNNAVTRSYLGKAYYELRNKDYASTELNIAKQMDPKDPTPWFYDAILKQITNRPVEALHDMQKAIELNDNRAVYRSSLLLDKDAAARTANLARIYNDLGFGRVALKQAWNALGYDATSPSAHRFLSDAYIGQPRYRVARASELLQAQLLQPINITPVQPQLTAENIGILNTTGPANLSTNEYDPLYTSNGAHIVLNGAYGSRNTKTDNAIISGIYDNLSMSLGQFHYQTDGFRVNDDYKQDIYNAFAQYAISPDLSFQVEFKSEDIRAGDPTLFLNGFRRNNRRQTIEQDTARIGGHYKIDQHQNLLASFIYTTRSDSTRQSFRGSNSINTFTQTKFQGTQAELQHLFRLDSFEATTGFGYQNLGYSILTELLRNNIVINPNFQRPKTNYYNAYLYSKQFISPYLTTTLGVSFDSYDDGLSDKSLFNPKLGVIGNPINNLILRAAWFRTITRSLTINQSIEPTQVAGFNQFIDDFNGASAWEYAFGLDYNPVKNIFIGGEATWRNISQTTLIVNNSVSSTIKAGRDEYSHLAYFYWILSDWATLRSEYRIGENKIDSSIASLDTNTTPQRLLTHQTPISMSFFHPSGFFTKITGTYVNQHAKFGINYLSQDFWTFDTSIGYRFPKKIGSISFDIRNAFDNKFNYQSASDYGVGGPQLSPYIPERQFFARLSLFY
ncbi:MAG: tetratricopeptide repeat protein [Methylobacter sp.]|nr:tetratricopeptide repeat protein [Methylobacter sp.]